MIMKKSLATTLARIFRTRMAPLINTGASARWKDAHSTRQLFQQFLESVWKPLKRLRSPISSLHRAKAPALMRTCWHACQISTLAVVLLAAVAASLPTRAAAQNVVDQIEVVRGALKADRKIVIAVGMQLTDEESSGFWPIYRDYRTAMDKLGDGRIELVLEYADLYPNVPEDRAKQMLKKYAALEEKTVSVRNKYLKKLGKVLPASKVLRFAQLENRLDLAVRVQVAASIPLVPSDSRRQ